MSATLEGSTTRSGKYYRAEQEKDHFSGNPLRRENMQGSPVTPTSDSQESKPSTETLLEGDMAVHLKLPTFKGATDEDMECFWFVANSVWTAQGVVSDTVKRA